MLTQRNCVVTKTALVGGTVYHEASWWALTDMNCAVAGPNTCAIPGGSSGMLPKRGPGV